MKAKEQARLDAIRFLNAALKVLGAAHFITVSLYYSLTAGV